MTKPRVAIVGMYHETNTYAAHAATMEDFEFFELASGAEIVGNNLNVGSVIGGFLDAGDAFDLVPVFSAGAWPCGPATADTWQTLRERFERELAAAGPVDGVLLNLHGAMVAEGCDYVEVATAEIVRRVAGQVPVAAVLDLHANVHPRLCELVDIVVGYDTYPHIDMRERGREAADLLQQMLAGEAMCTVLAKSAMLTVPLAQGTEDQPMKGLLERAQQRGRDAGVVRVSIAAGFPYDDIDTVGNSVYVVCKAPDRAAAAQVANDTIADIEGCATEFEIRRPGPAAAVAEALAQTVRPVVIADVADNVGGGCAGDSTAIVAELLAQQAPDAVAIIADHEIAKLAYGAGVGGTVTNFSLGAKTDDLHGDPVEIAEATVKAITDGDYVSTSTWQTGRHFSLGPSALLEVDGVQILVTTYAVPPFHRDQLTIVGVDPGATDIVVTKSAIAWRAAFPDAAVTIEVDGPGACPIDLARLTRTKTPMEVRATA